MILLSDPTASAAVQLLAHCSLLLLAIALAPPMHWDRDLTGRILRRLYASRALTLALLRRLCDLLGGAIQYVAQSLQRGLSRAIGELPRITQALTLATELLIALATFVGALLALLERLGGH